MTFDISIIITIELNKQNTCVFRGKCGVGGSYKSPIPCVYNGKPSKIPAENVSLIEVVGKYCPELGLSEK